MKTVSEESAPATEVLDTPHSMDEAMETGFLPDDEHYRLTGEFKKPASEKPEESATSKPSEKTDASAAATKDEPEQDDPSKAAASGTAQTQQTSGRESRWQKRERELKEARAKIARLEAQQTSQPQTRSESAQPSTQTTQAATETKAAPKPKIDDVDEKTGKPKYKSFAEYEDAKDQWLRQDTLREFNESQAKTQQVTAQQRQFEETKKFLNDKWASARAKYPDFDKVALNDIDPATGKLKYPDAPVLRIPEGSAAETFLMDSEHSGEVLYYLGQHPDILNGFYGPRDEKTGRFPGLVPPAKVFRKLMEIEAQFSGAAPNGKSGDDKTSSSSSARPVTQASRPPHQVSGTGTVAKDAVEQALEDGDFETYQRAQNAKELARLKKK
jgi:hypothetical protein